MMTPYEIELANSYHKMCALRRPYPWRELSLLEQETLENIAKSVAKTFKLDFHINALGFVVDHNGRRDIREATKEEIVMWQLLQDQPEPGSY